MASLLPEPGHDKLSAVVILGCYDKLIILAMPACAAADSVDLLTIPTAESVVVSAQVTNNLECPPAVFNKVSGHRPPVLTRLCMAVARP